MKYLYTVAVLCMLGCKPDTAQLKQQAKKEIADAEKQFEAMATEKGLPEAFGFFADSTAVINRGGDSLIHGKDGIRKFYDAPHFKSVRFTWSPDFIDASESGELGYTYGKFTHHAKDSLGNVKESSGFFHTVWKKQKNGEWKFLWD